MTYQFHFIQCNSESNIVTLSQKLPLEHTTSCRDLHLDHMTPPPSNEGALHLLTAVTSHVGEVIPLRDIPSRPDLWEKRGWSRACVCNWTIYHTIQHVQCSLLGHSSSSLSGDEQELELGEWYYYRCRPSPGFHQTVPHIYITLTTSTPESSVNLLEQVHG